MQLQLDQLWQLRETAEVNLTSAAGEVLKFRVERFEPGQSAAQRNDHQFRVFRYDTFRIQPSFQIGRNQRTSLTWADHEILVVDPMFGITSIVAESPERAWAQLWAAMQHQFSAT